MERRWELGGAEEGDIRQVSSGTRALFVHETKLPLENNKKIIFRVHVGVDNRLVSVSSDK